MEKSKSFMLKINLIFLFAIFIGDVLYIYLNTLPVKAITSVLFVILGVINMVYLFNTKANSKKFAIFLFIGLCFAFAGDVLLEIEFIVGAALFGLGHVFFFTSYCMISPFKLKDFMYAALIIVPSIMIITLVPLFDFGSELMQIVCLVYAFVISLMLGKAIGNFIDEKSALNLIILIGSALFFFSDFMLLFNVFANISKIFGCLCLLSYYPAEFMLAFSIYKAKK